MPADRSGTGGTDAGGSRRHLLVLLISLAAGAATAFALRQPGRQTEGGLWAWALLLAASALSAATLRRVDRWLPEDVPPPQPEEGGRVSSRRAGIACLTAALLVSAWIVVRLWPNHYVWKGTFTPWVVALALTVAGGFLLGPSGPRTSGTRPHAPPAAEGGATALPRWLEIGAFVAIAALAIVVRLHRIGTLPPGIYVDETNGAMDALHLLEGQADSPFGVLWYGSPAAFAYYMAGLFRLFGADWGALKAVSLIPAILTVLAIYPLGRLLFGPLGGLCAMAFLATSRWHMSMSRWGWAEVAPPLFQVLATFLLLRGLRDRRSSDFALGGTVAGLMMYTYLSSRLALATLGLFAALYLVLDDGGPVASWRRHWRGLVLFLAAWTVAAAPIAVTHLKDPFSFSNRVAEISVFRDVAEAKSLGPLWLNVLDHARFFHQLGDKQGKHNLPGEPHADPLVGALFLAGLLYGLLRLRDPRRGLLWLWLVLGMAGGVFSSHHESPQSYRTLTAVPAVALLAGDVLARSTGAARALGRGRRPEGGARAAAPAVALVVGATGFSAVWETRVYFTRQADDVSVRSGFNPVENGVARDVLDAMRRGVDVYLSPRFCPFSPVRFLVWGEEKRTTGRSDLDAPPFRPVSLEQDLPIPATGRDALLLVDAYYEPMLDYVREFYPGVSVEPARAPDEGQMYLRLRLSAAERAAAQGLRARVTQSRGGVRDLVTPELSGSSLPSGASRADWSGGLLVEAGDRCDFEPVPGLALSVDGEPWAGERFLSRGLHGLEASLDGTPPPEWRLSWRRGSQPVAPVEPRLLFRRPPPEVGLTGVYYASPDWRGDPVFRRTTPFLLLTWQTPEPIPWTGQFSVRFLGSLRVPVAGEYGFRVDADDGARLVVDGRRLGEALVPGQPNRVEGKVSLVAGTVPIELDYVQWGGGAELQLFWQPPGGREEIVPPRFLVPLPPGSGR